MSERSVVIIGLPESGKTTYLAALWHVVTARDVKTILTFGSLLHGDRTYLNEIAKRWRDAVKQERTRLVRGSKMVSMNLKNAVGEPLRVTFPDLPGEEFSRMWEERECDPAVVEILRAGGVLLFVHTDTIRFPVWLVEEIEFNETTGIKRPADENVAWAASMAPTQVQLVDLLQLLRSSPLDIGLRKVAIILSAWDKVKPEGLRWTPIVRQPELFSKV
jgi:GTPase SAR1 family protein